MFSSLSTSGRERRGQLFVQRHGGFLECQRRGWPLPGVSNSGQRRNHEFMQHHNHRVFHQQCDLRKNVYSSGHLRQRSLQQPAHTDPQHPVRYDMFKCRPSLDKSIYPVTYLPLVYFLAPCQPQGIRGRLDCVSNSAWISWNATDGADSYFVSAVGGEDRIANCSTSSNTTCEVEDLACGVLYNFSVIAKNSKCESQPSATIGLQTGNRFLTLRKKYAGDAAFSANLK